MCRRRSLTFRLHGRAKLLLSRNPGREDKRGSAGASPSPVAVLLICLSFAAGCVQEMADQPRYEPLEPLTALPAGYTALGPIAGTIARGQLQLDEAFFSGKEQGELVTEMPAQAWEGANMAQMLARGQERFVVFCSQCHGQVGGGIGGSDELRELVGMVVQRGFPVPPTYHQPRLRDAPIGHFFDVVTNGFGRMPAHGYLIPPQDRWAIAAYIRALQLSQYAARDQLTPLDLQQLQTPTGNE
jgi:mono/diheme cytochrome c family protein